MTLNVSCIKLWGMTQNNTTASSSRSLTDLSIGQDGTILSVSAEGSLRQRILDMGLTKGASVRIIRYAPLGDPMEIAVRGYTLTLRKSEAAHIIIQ